uniref:Calponin-homology (CH) domain-containing protein n=1 Tax=Ditylenchus dipsaci TaxID=166011 RepID=A0A915EGS7_9BILA
MRPRHRGGIYNSLNTTTNSRRNRRGIRLFRNRPSCLACCFCPTTMSISEFADVDELMQKKTFTKWINFHLDQHSSSGRVVDLYEDLKDGVLLCHLVEVLTGDALPINKTKSSKRIHHISNLTTALSAIRKRGLELINNNPADIADGNPRIILGLIWQIILHFQVESNLRLLHYHGWRHLAEFTQQIPLHTTTPANQPSTSKSSSSIPAWISRQFSTKSKSPKAQTPTSTSTTPEAPSIHKLSKVSIEKLLLKWLQEELAGWKSLLRSGPPLLAPLIHMDTVLDQATTPTQRLELAFEVARQHLNIRPLLDVQDVLVEKPDKRSIITYISQFLRISCGGVVTSELAKPEVVDVRAVVRLSEELQVYKPLVDWLEEVVRDSRLKRGKENVEKQKLEGYKWYVKTRQEFIERRTAYKEIVEILKAPLKEQKKQLEQIEKDWKLVSDSLHEWAVALESEYQQPFCDIAKWVDQGEHLLQSRTPVKLDTKLIDESLTTIETTIQLFETFFKDCPEKREIFYPAYQTFQEHHLQHNKDSSDPTFPLLDMLKHRFEALSNQYPFEIRRLLLHQAYYRTLGFQADLKTKLRLWENATSYSLTKRWLAEYNKTSSEKPDIHLQDHLITLKKAAECLEQGEMHTKGLSMFTEMDKQSYKLYTRFSTLHSKLEQLLKHWTDFDLAEDRALASDLALEHRIQHLAECTRIVNSIEAVQTSPAVGHAAQSRLARIKKLFNESENMNFPSTSKTVISTPSGLTPGQSPPTKRRKEVLIEKKVEGKVATKFVRWIQKTSICLQQKATDTKSATDLIHQLTELEKEHPEAMAERQRYLSRLKDTTQEQRDMDSLFEQLHNQLQARLDSFKMVYPPLASAEKNLLDMEKWTAFHDPDSEMAKLSIKERSEVVDQIKLMLDNLETSEHKALLDISALKEIYMDVSKCFALVEIRRIEVSVEVIETRILVRRIPAPTAKDSTKTERTEAPLAASMKQADDALLATVLENIEQVRVRDPEAASRISALRQKIHVQQQTKDQPEASSSSSKPFADRVKKLLRRKAVVGARKEDSEELAKTSIIEMDMLNESLREHKGTSNEEYQRLEAEWKKKLAGLDRLLMIISEIKKLEKSVDNFQNSHVKAELIKSNLLSIGRILECEIQIDIPLVQATKLRLKLLLNKLEQCMADEHYKKKEALKQRLAALEMTSQDDLRIGLDIVKEISEEAVNLHKKAPYYTEVLEKADLLERDLRHKMEFFNRLQLFHDKVKDLKVQNDQWDTISSLQINGVLESLNQQLVNVQNILDPERQMLESEISALEGNFFQLEHDRVRQKFLTLSDQLNKLVSLMQNRQIFLLRLNEFQEFVDNCKTTLLEASQTSQGKKRDINRLTSDLNSLLPQLQSIASGVCETQEAAHINVTDLSIEEAIMKLQEIAVPSVGSLSKTETIVEESNKLRTSLSTPVAEFDATDISNLHSYIANLQFQIQSHSAQIQHIQELVNTNKDAVQVSDLPKIISSLQEATSSHNIQLEHKVEHAISQSILQLSHDLEAININLNQAFSHQEQISQEEFNLRQCSSKLGN